MTKIKLTERNFNKSTLTPIEDFSPKEVKVLRGKCNVSQSSFAKQLNVSTKLVQKWEQGLSAPRGAALKLLCLVKKHGSEFIR